MSALPRILIVDQSAESREVLRTLLERSGATTIEAGRPEQAIRLADLHQPDLIVLDVESDPSPSGDGAEGLQAAARRNHAPIVILGTLRQPRSSLLGQIVAKPYHYGHLIRKIEELLDAV